MRQVGTHTRARARTRTRTHTHAHTDKTHEFRATINAAKQLCWDGEVFDSPTAFSLAGESDRSRCLQASRLALSPTQPQPFYAAIRSKNPSRAAVSGWKVVKDSETLITLEQMCAGVTSATRPVGVGGGGSVE